MNTKGTWITAEEAGYSTEEIRDIVEKLYQEEILRAGKCPDCGVSNSEKHQKGCDVPHCTVCGKQAIQCKHNSPEVWNGLWPNTDICYREKLVCFWGTKDTKKGDPSIKWTFDYNRAAVIAYANRN